MSWQFTGETNLKKIEKIQERALRFIYNDYSSSYHELLTMSGLPSLKVRRMRTLALEVYKIIHKEGPTYLHDLVIVKDTRYSFRNTNTAALPRFRTVKYGKQSFRYAAAELWNSLPNAFREASSFNQFQSLISGWDGPKCKCSVCRT